jgi:hypothetical protein
MTTSPVVTTGEQVAETLHRLGYLIGQHDLPAPEETRIRQLGVAIELGDLHKLKRWADATNAAVTTNIHYAELLHEACTVLGDVPLRMTAFGKEAP